jgi:hypothetical protein
VRATVLAPGKGWVLAMLAMLGLSRPVRGCAWLRSRRPKRRRPCPALCSVANRGCRDEGRPATTTPKKPCRAGVEQRADKEGSGRVDRDDSPPAPTEGVRKLPGWPLKAV